MNEEHSITKKNGCKKLFVIWGFPDENETRPKYTITVLSKNIGTARSIHLFCCSLKTFSFKIKI